MSVTGASESLLALSQQEQPVDLPRDYPLSASEDDEDSNGERKHRKLLEAISSLDGKNRWKLAERSEANQSVSEFNISSEGIREKLALSDLFQPIKMSSSLVTVKKQLKRVKAKKTVALPLNKEEVARIHREIRTPLEQEILNILHKYKQPVTDPLLTPVEKASLQAMSLEEAKMRRAELQRARALQSYYEAQARRQKKIKSKKYHRVVKKGKAKKALKDLETLRKVSPTAAASEELEKMEKARMMERMCLKHQNNGKGTKSKSFRAKYDLKSRQAMQEQLAKNRELTQKLQVASESDDEAGGVEEDGLMVPDVSAVLMDTKGSNPWMCRSCTCHSRESEIQKDPELPPEHVTLKDSESEEEESPVAEENTLLKEFEERQSLRKRPEPSTYAEPMVCQETQAFSSQEVLSELKALSRQLSKEDRQSRKQKVNSIEVALRSQEEEKPLLLQRPERIQTLEKLSKEGCSPNMEIPRPVLQGQQRERNPDNQPEAPKKKRKEQTIDLQNLLTTKSPFGKSLAVPTLEELEGEEERNQKQMIKEAFAGDDVIRDFLKEKRESVEASKPKGVELTLPGWGEWGGGGLQPSAKNRRRFLMNAPEGPPREDKHLPNVIISEKRNIHAAAHQVHVLPYPFSHHQQLERTIQVPVGCTWNTQRAFQKLTTPKVVTKPGHVIEPIKAEDVGYLSSPRSDLSVMQRIPKGLSVWHRKQLKDNSAG
ncbi:PREDICTED: U3 small nucleolar RNA-associated protein 14 homolog A-like [Chrysochloris asiatica]|uniref:U3 small nucleolar RNA-associated protein 14 homolog A-like n=1 Tax=Chrysochloris asiatica TaxID=185453 RepID=A0A9B0TBR2_CHRAS|nr:PREDICTED: U3 small nucleolar RNA-associated protein 14 homolog A-like [Chrysochloris asiatica]